jgi:peptide/nickel transport system permease protein
MSIAEVNMEGSSEIGTQVQWTDKGNETEESYFQLVVRRFKKHKLAVAGLAVMSILILIAIFAPFIALHDPYQVTGFFEAEPSPGYWLGTDQTGRDVLSRLIYAARVSLTVGIGSVLISVGIGTILGLISGFFGGWVDMAVMRITDVFMSFPQLMLILVIVSMVGPSLTNVIWVLGLLGWTAVARLVRGSVLSVKQVDFVKAGVALGLGAPRILFAHILPNVSAPIIVHATFGIAGAILVEASLSFLGLGVQPPTASWGNMLTDAQSLTVLTSQPWLWVPPGFMIIIAVLSVNFIGDGLRDALDPKSMK